jgi:hypothetical protein
MNPPGVRPNPATFWITPGLSDLSIMNNSFILVLRTVALPALALASLVLPACSTPDMRAQENPGIMQSLSPADRALVLNHQIRMGLPKQGVFIAYGAPDRVVRGVSKQGLVETWIYTTTQSAYVGGYGGYYGGYYGGFGGPFAPGLGYGRFYGGRYGYRGYYWGNPGFYYSPWIYYQVPHRRVLFSKDRVVGYEEIQY